MDDPVEPDLEVLSCGRLQTQLARAALFALGVTTAACGTFVPPVAFEAGGASSTTEDEMRQGLAIEPVEGRPSGLVLRLSADFAARTGGRLEVRRTIGSGSARRLRSIELGPRGVEAFAGDGIQFIDRSVEIGERHRYRLTYFAPSGERDSNSPADRRSKILSVTWGEPPPRPERVTARADTARAVELRWRPDATGALVFRRDVLADSGASRRIASLPSKSGGVTLDRDVRAGRVYAYRVALAIERDGYTQYGPPSESLYVSVPGS